MVKVVNFRVFYTKRIKININLLKKIEYQKIKIKNIKIEYRYIKDFKVWIKKK